MAAAHGRENPGLSEQLFQEPHRFDFFQAVRLLERLAHEQTRHDPRRQRQPVGQDQLPEREVVRFRTLPSLSFPASAVSQIRPPERRAGAPNAEPSPPEMVVTFLGLVGAAGVLPYHYTALLRRRMRLKDQALRDFLDLFHHRLLSLFYRAWEKYRLPVNYERFQLGGTRAGEDAISQGLYCLVGLGTGGLRGRLAFDDEAFLFYAGHFAHAPRSAVALECLLEDYFEMPIRVQQLQGQWLALEREDQALLPDAEHPRGCNNRLGLDLVVGERVWEVQSKFRLRVGPLTYRQFRALMPNGDGLRPLCQLARTYAGAEFDFDVQGVLAAAEVPWCRLGSANDDGAYLGWNTWVRCEAFAHSAEDAVFEGMRDEG
jgi:type VI secretion system protein ImpH